MRSSGSTAPATRNPLPPMTMACAASCRWFATHVATSAVRISGGLSGSWAEAAATTSKPLFWKYAAPDRSSAGRTTAGGPAATARRRESATPSPLRRTCCPWDAMSPLEPFQECNLGGVADHVARARRGVADRIERSAPEKRGHRTAQEVGASEAAQAGGRGRRRAWFGRGAAWCRDACDAGVYLAVGEERPFGLRSGRSVRGDHDDGHGPGTPPLFRHLSRLRDRLDHVPAEGSAPLRPGPRRAWPATVPVHADPPR